MKTVLIVLGISLWAGTTVARADCHTIGGGQFVGPGWQECARMQEQYNSMQRERRDMEDRMRRMEAERRSYEDANRFRSKSNDW
jgi:hypothetical protein